MKKNNIDIKQIIIMIILCIVTVLMIYLYYNTKVNNLGLDNEECSVINQGYSISYNNKQEKVNLPVNIKENAYDVVINRHFTRNELRGNYMSFYAYNPACEIYVNDRMVVNEDKSNDVFNLANPSHWYCFEVPAEDFDLTINMHNSLKLSTIFEFYTGTKSALIFDIFKKHIFSLIMSLIVFLVGVGITISSFFIKDMLSVRLRWLGLTSVVSGLWLFSLSNISQLFIKRTSTVAFLGYCSFFMLPLLVTGFLLTYESFKKSAYMNILFWFQMSLLLVIFTLQTFDIVQWTNLLIIVHIEVILIIAGIIFTFIKNLHNDKSDEKFIYYALMIISAFICIDIIRYYVYKPADGMIKYSTYGLMVLLMYLTYSVIHMITKSSLQETKNAIYRELAFKDAMTQLENRSSYEMKIKQLRENSCNCGNVMIADLNNLKYINDNYGHHYGDDAIIRTATLLRRFFLDIAGCYRTGGDEFCIISEDGQDVKFLERVEQFKEAVHEEETLIKYPYSVAVGVGNIQKNGIDDCIKSVDAKMYKDKHDSKKGRK